MWGTLPRDVAQHRQLPSFSRTASYPHLALDRLRAQAAEPPPPSPEGGRGDVTGGEASIARDCGGSRRQFGGRVLIGAPSARREDEVVGKRTDNSTLRAFLGRPFLCSPLTSVIGGETCTWGTERSVLRAQLWRLRPGTEGQPCAGDPGEPLQSAPPHGHGHPRLPVALASDTTHLRMRCLDRLGCFERQEPLVFCVPSSWSALEKTARAWALRAGCFAPAPFGRRERTFGCSRSETVEREMWVRGSLPKGVGGVQGVAKRPARKAQARAVFSSALQDDGKQKT